MIVQLGKIAAIRIGSPFRERIVHDQHGQFLVVQGKDIGSDGTLILDGMVTVAEAPNKKSADTLIENEIVFQTRGVSYRAAVVPKAHQPMLAAGSLFILSPEPARITTEYLVFFLNLPATQAALRQMATGSTIPNLRRAAIEQLKVPLPNLSDQRRLVELGTLIRKQSDITKRINRLRLHELHALTVERAKKAGGVGTPPASNRPERRGKRPQTMS
jgi:restriction endonuclease S subunit